MLGRVRRAVCVWAASRPLPAADIRKWRLVDCANEDTSPVYGLWLRKDQVRAVAQNRSEHRPGNHIAEEVQAQQNPRCGNTESAEQHSDHQRWVEQTQRYDDRKG